MRKFAPWIILLSVCIRSSHPHAVERSSSGIAPQTCGADNVNFYCPYDLMDRCKPRNQRCTGSNVCINPATMTEDECLETRPGEYRVQLGHAKLTDSSSSKKRSLRLKLEHQFIITFRGFTYEFGKSYGVQVLDIIDPMYKYLNGLSLIHI